MKRVIVVILIGSVAGMISIPLALLPGMFNSIESSMFNRNLRLTWFLGCSLQGLLAAGLLVASWQKARPRHSVQRILQTWGITALLGVMIPAPSILNGRYADCLTLWYAALVGIAGILFVWTHWPLTTQKKREAEPNTAPLPSEGASSDGR